MLRFLSVLFTVYGELIYLAYLGSKPASPGYPVKVGVGILRHVVVEHDVDTLNVHPSTEQVGCDQDTLLEILELLIPEEIRDKEETEM